MTHARLIIGDTDHGVHPFFVQLRSLEDHSPLPGVTVGDIGPKLGYHTQVHTAGSPFVPSVPLGRDEVPPPLFPLLPPLSK